MPDVSAEPEMVALFGEIRKELGATTADGPV
jgi:hypothetical protein